MRVSASIRNRRAGKIVFPRAVYSRLQLTHTGRQTSCKHGQLTAQTRPDCLLVVLCGCSGKEAMLLMQSLNKLNTPEQKLEAIIKKHAELVS